MAQFQFLICVVLGGKATRFGPFDCSTIFLYFVAICILLGLFGVLLMWDPVNMEPKFGQHSKSKYCLELHIGYH